MEGSNVPQSSCRMIISIGDKLICRLCIDLITAPLGISTGTARRRFLSPNKSTPFSTAQLRLKMKEYWTAHNMHTTRTASRGIRSTVEVWYSSHSESIPFTEEKINHWIDLDSNSRRPVLKSDSLTTTPPSPSTTPAFWNILYHSWTSIAENEQLLVNLVESTQRRLQTVIESNEGRTKFWISI